MKHFYAKPLKGQRLELVWWEYLLVLFVFYVSKPNNSGSWGIQADMEQVGNKKKKVGNQRITEKYYLALVVAC